MLKKIPQLVKTKELLKECFFKKLSYTKKGYNLSVKTTLSEMLNNIQKVDEGILEIKPEDLKEMFGNVKGKVDDTFAFLEYLKSYEARLKTLVDDFTARKTTIANLHKSIKDHVGYVLAENETDTLYGNLHQVSISYRQTKKATNVDLTTDHYIDLNEGLNMPVVKREYSWDAIALKKAYSLNPKKYKDYVVQGKTRITSFKVKKEEKIK